MPYKFPNTSLRGCNLAPDLSCCFARLMEFINSLLDIIFRVSVIRFQSSMLITTDFGLPSSEVMNSTFGSSRVFNTVKPPFFLSELNLNEIYHKNNLLVKKSAAALENFLTTV